MPRSLPSKLLISISSLMLAHACYSAHEHSLLPAAPTTITPEGTNPVATSTLPLDITIETLVSLSLLLVAIVSDGWELKPISLRKYAGMLESGQASQIDGGLVDAHGRVLKSGHGRGVYDALEERAGFIDVRKERKQFTDWVKEGQLKEAIES